MRTRRGNGERAESNNFDFSLDYAQPKPGVGLTGVGTDDHIRAVAEVIPPEQICMILHPKNIADDDLTRMYRAGVRLVRLCLPSKTPEPGPAMLRRAADIGFTTTVNITRVSRLDRRRLVELAALSEDAGADVIYLADSNGSLLSEEVSRLVTLVRSVTGSAIGLHAHNNLGLALANSTAAVDAGATWEAPTWFTGEERTTAPVPDQCAGTPRPPSRPRQRPDRRTRFRHPGHGTPLPQEQLRDLRQSPGGTRQGLGPAEDPGRGRRLGPPADQRPPEEVPQGQIPGPGLRRDPPPDQDGPAGHPEDHGREAARHLARGQEEPASRRHVPLRDRRPRPPPHRDVQRDQRTRHRDPGAERPAPGRRSGTQGHPLQGRGAPDSP
ncbi:hypothetical protein IAG44_17905 [Streptomyces roseirectus]|uniref:Pyruvate carboxyltransferase domain-containing protein n=1 Tax=Streptomyces roseirectus TaxID=2768066 RepID=A0A7H0IEB3_9ACTN|nr:hypothetical protein IAG44_17905 [Streptomyces roseirectus]